MVKTGKRKTMTEATTLNVTPDHPLAHEAYEQIKNLRCDYVCILAQTYKKSDTEVGYFVAGIYPHSGEGGFNRLDWLTEYEMLIEQSHNKKAY